MRTNVARNAACPVVESASLGALERRFEGRIEINPDLDRQLVSFQANAAVPPYSWFKYREGFSAALVHYLLCRCGGSAGRLLDPFAGSGAALFASAAAGWRATGIELLPIGHFVGRARLAVQHVERQAFERVIEVVLGDDFSRRHEPAFAFPHIRITRGAFSPQAEQEIAGYRAVSEAATKDPHVRTLLSFACFSVLESVSFTRKDGQYLRWDTRSGRGRGTKGFTKGNIPPFRNAIEAKLRTIAGDIRSGLDGGSAAVRPTIHTGDVQLMDGSCLERLPKLPSRSVDLVITSPPYCNRYDYTRTYALELAYLGFNDDQVKALRQRMLSCTVENKQKREELRALYDEMDRADVYNHITDSVDGHEALRTVVATLESYRDAGKLNNRNVPTMVQNYFFEMAVVIKELARILCPGGRVFMVNDNVRYGGTAHPRRPDLICLCRVVRIGR